MEKALGAEMNQEVALLKWKVCADEDAEPPARATT